MSGLDLDTAERQLREYCIANAIDLDALAEDAGRHFAGPCIKPTVEITDADIEALVADDMEVFGA